MKLIKKYIVTGVSQGIGSKIKELLLEEGCTVIGIDKTEDSQLEILNKKYSEKYIFHKFDLGKRDLLKDFIDNFSLEIDGIVNNAGEIYFNDIESFDENLWDRTIEVNLSSVMFLTQGLYKKINPGGSIVNITSVDGTLAAFDTIPYAVSKAGLINLTKSLGVVLGKYQIRVNAIAPGWVETEMTKNTLPSITKELTPLNRNAQSEDVAQLVLFLLSDKSSFINTQTITLDGGLFSVDYTLWKEYQNGLE
jgi:NAD(P)-dependent dehydrogenase (short-subunit alcohol dehydrogenase family)